MWSPLAHGGWRYKEQLSGAKGARTEGKRLVFKHGDINGMDMPAMSMAFPVKDAKMLDSLKPGDRIRFSVEQSGADLVVTKIDKAK